VGFLDRFWNRVRQSEGCWLWTGPGNRYGFVSSQGKKTVLAHRFAFEVTHGFEVPAWLFVCHSCDTPKCVRPDHRQTDFLVPADSVAEDARS